MEKLNIEPPKIEKVSEDEIYLLDHEGNRTKRICGSKREGIPEEFPCVENAGKGTSHQGVGRCKLHDKSVQKSSKQKNTYEIILKDKNPSTLLDYLAAVSSLDPEHLTSLDPEIQILQGILSKYINQLKDAENISIRQIDEISKIVTRLGNLKKEKADSIRNMQIDFRVVDKFIKNIFGIIKRRTTKEVSQKILNEILQNVVTPMMNKEEIEQDDLSDLRDLK